MTHLPAYAKPYPMPALPLPRKSAVHQRGLDALGWRSMRVPRLINSVPYNERPGCIHCQQCVGFACPVDAKNGSHNTTVPRALRSNYCTLKTEVMVQRAVVQRGRPRDRRELHRRRRSGDDMQRRCGRAQLRSGGDGAALAEFGDQPRAERHRHAGDQVGRHLQGHYYSGAVGLFPEDMWDGVGPGCSIATSQFSHGNDGIIGGGFLGDEDIVTPVTL